MSRTLAAMRTAAEHRKMRMGMTASLCVRPSPHNVELERGPSFAPENVITMPLTRGPMSAKRSFIPAAAALLLCVAPLPSLVRGQGQNPAPAQGRGRGQAQVQNFTAEQRQLVDAAVPAQAPAKPKQPRRLLVITLQMRDGAVTKGPSYFALPAQNYALEQMGKRTGAYEVTVSDDVELLRAGAIDRFDASCFCNSLGVLTADPVLRKSILDFVAAGKGVIGIHDGLATFVQWPVY